MNARDGWKLPDAELPEAAEVMLNTRSINRYLGTSYTLDEVAEMDPVLFTMLAALRQGENPPKVNK